MLDIFTGRDVPNNEYGLVLFDAPVLVSGRYQVSGNDLILDTQHLKPFDTTVRHIGEKIAFIVAETEAIAEQARDLIRVEYEDLPVLVDIHEAIKPGAQQLHPHYMGNVIQHNAKLQNTNYTAIECSMYRCKLDRWPCHVTVTAKKACFFIGFDPVTCHPYPS